MTACQLQNDQRIGGAQLGKVLQIYHGHCQQRRKRLSGSLGIYRRPFQTLWAALVPCNIEMRPSVTNYNLGGCSTAKRGQSVGTVFSTKLPVQGDENLLGVRGAKLDDVKFWHVNKGSPIC